MPIYHRPQPLPPLYLHGMTPKFYFPKPVPFASKPSARRIESKPVESPKAPRAPRQVSMLASVAVALLLLIGLALAVA